MYKNSATSPMTPVPEGNTQITVPLKRNLVMDRDFLCGWIISIYPITIIMLANKCSIQYK